MGAKSENNDIVWNRCRGRNGFDVPSTLPDDIAAEAMNVTLRRGMIAVRRLGVEAQAFTGTAFTGALALARFLPGQDETLAELFIISNDNPIKILRVAGGTAAAGLTLTDAVTIGTVVYSTAILNGKLYLAYNSAVNRLHVYDPTLSTTQVRRVGLATPVAPTVANTGGGAYPAVLRYYRVAYRLYDGAGTLRLQSNLGAAVSFTPSGAGTAARVTKPAAISEDENRWVVFGSAGPDGPFYELAEQNVATTTYDDSALVGTYADNDPAPLDGEFTPWPSVKSLLSVGDRLVGFGVWETTAGTSLPPKPGRVYFSPVLDSSDADDDERVSASSEFQGWIDVSRNAGGVDIGLGGPIDGVVYVFQSRGIYLLVPTGDATAPFRRVVLSLTVGALTAASIIRGEDEAGRPCIYFLDPDRGPYRVGAMGLQWLGYDMQDIWAQVGINNAPIADYPAHGVYYAKMRQVWWYLGYTAGNNFIKLVFHVEHGQIEEDAEERGGWTLHTSPFGAVSAVSASVMFSRAVGAAMSIDLLPYVSDNGGSAASTVYRSDAPGVFTDRGSVFQSYVTSKAWGVAPLHANKQVMKAYAQMKSAPGTGVTDDIAMTLTSNFGEETRTFTAAMLSVSSPTRSLIRFEDASLTDAYTLQVTIGDPSARTYGQWELDLWTGTIDINEER